MTIKQLKKSIVLLCALCLSNPDAFVVRYNTERFLSGTLSNYDTNILFRAGLAGVAPAMELYEITQDEGLKQELRWYLSAQRGRAFAGPVNGISFESYLARLLLASEGFSPQAPSPRVPISPTTPY